MPRRDPERTCIVTRAVLPPARLIRFVADPGGTLVADLKNRLPGRGAWVSARADIVARAVERKAFSRALKREVTVPADLAATIDEALQREARQALSLANKAGAAVTGFAKVEAAIAAGPIAALIHAREASEDGRRKLAGALRRRLGDTISAVPVVTEFAGQELDLAFGRSNVIHAALVAGAGSDGFIDRWRRLRFYRGFQDDESEPPPGFADERIADAAGGSPAGASAGPSG